jgi:hypothetical protein
MMSRTVAAGLLAGATFTAIGTGSYFAARHNQVDAAAPTITSPAGSAAPHAPVTTETEAVVLPQADPVQTETDSVTTPAIEAPATAPAPPAPAAERVEPRRTSTAKPRRAAARPAAVTPAPDPVAPDPAPLDAAPVETAQPVATPTAPSSVPDLPAPVGSPAVEPAAVAEPVVSEIVVPASAVIGLEIERTITSEQAEVEDRVNARVTRDVYADGQLAIPAGARVVGNVTVVERGGKMKDRARLGIRFHTLVLADGRQVQLRTDPIYREGDSPGAESSKKIGGAAIGGAVLGAILGGGKGAMAGAAAGAAGGTAVVMAGGRNAATLASGSEVTVRLTAPVSIEARR